VENTGSANHDYESCSGNAGSGAFLGNICREISNSADTTMNVDDQSVPSDDQYVDNDNMQVDPSFNAIQIAGKHGRSKEQRYANNDSGSDTDSDTDPAANLVQEIPSTASKLEASLNQWEYNQAELANNMIEEYNTDQWKKKQARVADLCGVTLDRNCDAGWHRVHLNQPLSACLFSLKTQEYTEKEVYLVTTPRKSQDLEHDSAAGVLSLKLHKKQREQGLQAQIDSTNTAA